MGGFQVIEKDGTIYAYVVKAEADSDKKYNFLTDNSEPFQLGVNYYQAGDTIRNHYHLPRQINLAEIHEFIVIRHGRVRANVFDESHQLIHTSELATGDCILLARGGHGFDILEDTSIAEIKQGPYDSREKDKEFFDHPTKPSSPRNTENQRL